VGWRILPELFLGVNPIQMLKTYFSHSVLASFMGRGVNDFKEYQEQAREFLLLSAVASKEMFELVHGWIKEAGNGRK
jgi:hypothetical protein